MLNFFLWIFCIRFCAYQGSKRVIGTFNGLAWGVFGIFGVLTVMSSRRLDDESLDAALKEKYEQERVTYSPEPKK